MEQDVEMISRAMDGDADATAAMCDIFAPRLRAYLRRHGLSRDELDDAVQDTFARMLDAIARRRIRRETFEGWLFATARNVCVDTIRQSQRKSARGREDVSTLRSRPAEPEQEQRERIRAIERALESLPESLRVPLTLRHRDALSYREISNRMGISVNAVGVRIYRARRLLEDRLRHLL